MRGDVILYKDDQIYLVTVIFVVYLLPPDVVAVIIYNPEG